MPTPRSSLNRDYDLDDDRRRTPDRRAARRVDTDSDDREISLGTGTILGIFFALAVTCGVFFGFGYQMGRKASQSATALPADAGASTTSSTQSASKPSANNPFQAAQALFKKDQPAKPAASDSRDAADIPDTDTPAPTQPSRFPTATPASADLASERTRPGQSPASAEPSRAAQPTLVRASTAAAPAAAQPLAQPVAMPQPAAATATGTFVVQVAAVSHQEDAELLDSALKQRGYAVFVRQEPQDHLLHVQVGPFASRRDADIVRQHLLADGYNALLK